MSFTLLNTSPTPILHVGAVNSTDSGWKAFKNPIQSAVQSAPVPVVLDIVDEVLKDLAGSPGIEQTCAFKPFTLGNSIAVSDNVLLDTMGGYVTAVARNGVKVKILFPGLFRRNSPNSIASNMGRSSLTGPFSATTE